MAVSYVCTLCLQLQKFMNSPDHPIPIKSVICSKTRLSAILMLSEENGFYTKYLLTFDIDVFISQTMTREGASLIYQQSGSNTALIRTNGSGLYKDHRSHAYTTCFVVMVMCHMH